MQRTVGVDLAAQPPTTAAAEILWHTDGAEVQPPRLRCTDDELHALLSGLGPNDRAGVDCPFGWPVAFVEAIAAHADQQPWPGRDERLGHYNRMRMRMTDRITAQTIRRAPLSVSMDKLGAMAARWAYLADRLAVDGRPVDRAGAGPVIEVYPAAARVIWGWAGRSSADLLDAMPWLSFATGAARAYAKSGHAFDALIAALVARAASLGLTTPPSNDEERRAAAVEGWIHLPMRGSFAALRGPVAP